MIYQPMFSEFYFERVAPGVYDVICDNLATTAPAFDIDSAIEVLAGDQYDYDDFTVFYFRRVESGAYKICCDEASITVPAALVGDVIKALVNEGYAGAVPVSVGAVA